MSAGPPPGPPDVSSAPERPGIAMPATRSSGLARVVGWVDIIGS